MYFGAHFSIKGGFHIAAEKAREMGCTTLQIFTRSSRIWKSKPLDEKLVEKFRSAVNELKLHKPVVHLPYLPNFSTDDPAIYEKSHHSLREEILRCDSLGIPYLVIHIGSHKGKGVENGIKNVISHLEKVQEQLDKTGVKICLETMAGTKNSTGSRFEEIGKIIEGVNDNKQLGVCFDTAHVFAAGYDIRTPETVENTIEAFDDAIGLVRLNVIHCNDSKFDLNSGKDRHEHIGQGHIGKEGFRAFFTNKRVATLDVPVILETPIDERGNHETDFKALREIVGF
ncbi:MAG: deoxyribonuclease IV [Methanobacteriota archaeon]|nr:MAG: deoxyribonuclease IV [Euryarchaeota archaeon]